MVVIRTDVRVDMKFYIISTVVKFDFGAADNKKTVPRNWLCALRIVNEKRKTKVICFSHVVFAFEIASSPQWIHNVVNGLAVFIKCDDRFNSTGKRSLNEIIPFKLYMQLVTCFHALNEWNVVLCWISSQSFSIVFFCESQPIYLAGIE